MRDRLTRPLRRRRLAVAVAGQTGLRINIGAGAARLPGWLDTDVGGTAPYYLDATKEWPVATGSVAFVYADNMIEHVKLVNARAFLRHAHAALQPGGVIRIATPDVEGTARLYLEPQGPGDEHLERHRRHGYRVDHRVDLLNLTYLESGHHEGYLYDFAALEAELHAAGFADVVRCTSGESAHDALRGLEQRGADPTDELATLIVEATRP